MADAWLDAPRAAGASRAGGAPRGDGASGAFGAETAQRLVEGSASRGAVGRFLMIGLVAVAVALLLGVAVWARFLTGAAAAPIPASLTDAVPALAPPVPPPAGAEGAGVADASAAASVPTASTAGDAPVSASGGASGTGQAAAAQAAAGQAATQAGTGTSGGPALPASPGLATPSRTEPPVDGVWLDRMSAATGIPRRALQAYAAADLQLLREQPACGLGWNTLAGIGAIESGHGRQLNDAGYSTAPIFGPLVGGGIRAEGPMQFIPSTWARWGADADGDGVKDPNQIDDATLAAARYLCSYGSLTAPAGWRAAVFGYNHLDSYVAAVAAQASAYARRAGS
jgi:membrane-bound lytic murein transglycosylase B